MSIDLHIHSTMSDGTLTPKEIVKLAARKGLKAIALTDHDTFEGVQQAIDGAEGLDLEVVSGIELSVKCHGVSAHLLGYLFDHNSSKFQMALSDVQEGRIARNERILKKLSAFNIQISISELKNYAKVGQIGRPHIAKIMVKKGYSKSMDEAFDVYLGATGKAYTPRHLFAIDEAIDHIKKAGGIAVLAHPYTVYKSEIEFKGVVDELLGMGLDGIEAYYPAHSRKFRNEMIQLAIKKDLLVTGGSDYHGDIRPGTTLAGGKNVYVPAEVLGYMKKRAYTRRG